MGKLGKIAESLDGIKEDARRQKLIAEFGVDPSVFEEDEPISDAQIGHERMECIAKSIDSLGASVAEANTEQAGKLEESTTAQVIEIQSGLRKLAKSIEDASKGQDKRLESSIKSQGEVLQGAIAALVEAVSSIESTIVVEPPVTVSKVPIQFDIERNRQGYIASVIARPVDTIEKPTKTTEIQYN